MVYVGIRQYKFGRMFLSHMVADTLDELHEMANKIGINKKWFQDKENKPHYDICKMKKLLAIKFGAVLVDDREIIKILKNCYE